MRILAHELARRSGDLTPRLRSTSTEPGGEFRGLRALGMAVILLFLSGGRAAPLRADGLGGDGFDRIDASRSRRAREGQAQSLGEFLNRLRLEEEVRHAREHAKRSKRESAPETELDGELEQLGELASQLGSRQDFLDGFQRSSRGHPGEIEHVERPSAVFLPPEPSRESSDFRGLDPLRLKVHYVQRPWYLPGEQSQVMDQTPEVSRRRAALERLAKKEFYRHARRLLKKYWRKQFKDSISMTYEEYNERVSQINQIGRSPEHHDDFNADHYLNEARDEILDEGAEGEREITLIKVGPLSLNDSGSVKFDLPGLFGLGEEKELELSFDPDSEESAPADGSPFRKALYNGKHIVFKPQVRIKADPFRAIGGNTDRILRSYGASLEVTFYSDILKKELFSTEVEAKFRRNGDYAFFFNVVFQER